MSAGMKRVVAWIAFAAMAIVALVQGEDPSAYIVGLILVQVL